MSENSLSWFYNERHHWKDPMDGISGTVKNVIFRIVKSGQVVVYTPLEFTEAVKRFAPSIHAVYLLQSEMIKEPDDISAAPNIKKNIKYSQTCKKTESERRI